MDRLFVLLIIALTTGAPASVAFSGLRFLVDCEQTKVISSRKSNGHEYAGAYDIKRSFKPDAFRSWNVDRHFDTETLSLETVDKRTFEAGPTNHPSWPTIRKCTRQNCQIILRWTETAGRRCFRMSRDNQRQGTCMSIKRDSSNDYYLKDIEEEYCNRFMLLTESEYDELLQTKDPQPCAAEVERTRVGDLHWSETDADVLQTLPCPSGQGLVSRYCAAANRWRDSNVTQCFPSESVDDAMKRVEKAISSGKAVFASELFNYTTKNLTQNPTLEELDSALSTLEILSKNLSRINIEVARPLTEAISNLLEVPVSGDNVSYEMGLKFIDSVEKIQSSIDETNNVANNVINSKKVSFSCLPILRSSENFFQFSSDGLLRRAFESAVADMNAAFTIVVPKSAAPNATRIHFSFLNSSVYFAAATRLTGGQRLFQQLLSASFGSGHVKDLRDPVVIKFLLPRPEDFTPSCVFWDSKRNQMSDIGCSTSSTKDAKGTAVICRCSHLTSFALLMELRTNSNNNPEFSKTFSALSYLGISLSVVGLLLTLVTYIYFRELCKKMPGKILIRLCFTLLFANLVFLAGAWYRIDDVACKVVGILLHYSYLSVMLWSSAVAVHVYLAIVKVFDAYISRFLLKAGLCAWGVPAVVVGITVIISPDNYCLKFEALCFLRYKPLLWAFAVPIAALMIANVVVFVLVIVKMRQSTCKHHVAPRRSDRENASTSHIRGSIGLCVLFGVTWVFGFFAVKEEVARGIFQTLFIVFHTTQGLFIFLVYCLFKTDVLMAWGKYCQCFRWMAGKLDHSSSSNTPCARAVEDKDVIGQQPTKGTAQTTSTQSSSVTYRNQITTSNEVEIN